MRKVLLLILLILNFLPVQAQDDSASRVKRSRSLYDYLWLEHSDESKLGQHFNEILKTLRESKVPSSKEAANIATRHKFYSSGLLAQEGAGVVGLIKVGVDVPDFCNKGELVWVVHISHFDRGVTQEMWINSVTGKVKCMLLPCGSDDARKNR